MNLLGAIDDGYGRWARGFFPEPIHPNAAGHTEMFHAFVPTLFDALEAGKPTPTRSAADGFARVRGRGRSPMTLSLDDTMRSFGLTFQVRAEGDGTIASIGGQTLGQEVDWVTVPFRRAELDFEAMTLTPTGRRFQATIAIQNGRWVYTSANGNAVTSPQPGADGQWHHVTLAHHVARGQTHFYVDGRLVGTIDERPAARPLRARRPRPRLVDGGPRPGRLQGLDGAPRGPERRRGRGAARRRPAAVESGALRAALGRRVREPAQSLSEVQVDGRAVSATTEN